MFFCAVCCAVCISTALLSVFIYFYASNLCDKLLKLFKLRFITFFKTNKQMFYLITEHNCRLDPRRKQTCACLYSMSFTWHKMVVGIFSSKMEQMLRRGWLKDAAKYIIIFRLNIFIITIFVELIYYHILHIS